VKWAPLSHETAPVQAAPAQCTPPFPSAVRGCAVVAQAAPWSLVPGPADSGTAVALPPVIIFNNHPGVPMSKLHLPLSRRTAAALRTGLRPLRLLPLLALGATAAVQAQSTVNVYGLIDLSVGRFQSPGGDAIKGVESGKMSTSYFGLGGREDLGSGLFALYALESFMRNDTASAGRYDGDAFWARNAYVGLSSGAGTLTLGRNTTGLFVNTLVFNAFGDSFGFSPAIRHYFTSGTVTGDTGWSDSVKYASPKFGGFSFNAQGALGEGNGGRNLGASAMYFSGPFGAGLAWQKVEKGATVADTTTWQLSGSYSLAPFKFYAQYGEVDNKTAVNTYKISGLGAEMAVTDLGKMLLQWGKVSPDVGADLNTLSLGYDYLLSKRTDVYVVYMNDRASGKSSGSNLATGVRHRF
jgi:predicted porin